MKAPYSFLAAMLVIIGVTAANTSYSQAIANWDQVVVNPGKSPVVITVTSSITIPRGTTFSYPVYPKIESIEQGWNLGAGSPVKVTLPTADGQYTSDILTWSFPAGSMWSRDPAPTMYCSLYYSPVSGTAGVPSILGRIEVLRDGTTGVDAVVADVTAETPRYFTLQGVPVDNPTPGAIYIRLVGGRAGKVVF